MAEAVAFGDKFCVAAELCTTPAGAGELRVAVEDTPVDLFQAVLLLYILLRMCCSSLTFHGEL